MNADGAARRPADRRERGALKIATLTLYTALGVEDRVLSTIKKEMGPVHESSPAEIKERLARIEIDGHRPFAAREPDKFVYQLGPFDRKDSVGPVGVIATVLTVATYRLNGIELKAGDLPFRTPGDRGAMLTDADVEEVWRLADAIEVVGNEPPAGCYSVTDPARLSLRPGGDLHPEGRVYRYAADAAAEARRLRAATGHGYSTMRHDDVPAWATHIVGSATSAPEEAA